MSRFLNELQRAYRQIITEQEQPPVAAAPDASAEAGAVAPEQAVPTPVPEQPPEEEVQPLSSQAEVFYLRLISRALMIEGIRAEDEQKIIELGDINEENTQSAKELFVDIISVYSPDHDVLQNI
jgi:hypothetical protein